MKLDSFHAPYNSYTDPGTSVVPYSTQLFPVSDRGNIDYRGVILILVFAIWFLILKIIVFLLHNH
jgi:hypothetical protein